MEQKNSEMEIDGEENYGTGNLLTFLKPQIIKINDKKIAVDEESCLDKSRNSAAVTTTTS